MKNTNVFIFITLILFFTATTGMAQESTKVVVRVKAKDAKFVGDYTGGALIKITNAQTGKILAKGLTKGTTGNTKKLVISPKKRYEKISTKGAAKFTARLKIDKPVYATISATSTYRKEQEVTSSTQMWLIPGMDITGDGVILEMPGFIVDILNIQPYQTEKEGRGINFKTKVVMMCGCSTKPGGLWNSAEFKIKALLKQNGKVIQTVPLEFSGKTSVYEGSFEIDSPESYKIMVYAFDPRTANSGVDIEKITFQ